MDSDYDISSQGEDEFNEETLSNEEYDQLHRVLPILKEKLADYNREIPDFDLKEALYYNYFEVEPSLEEIKSKFKKRMYLFKFVYLEGNLHRLTGKLQI